MPRPRVSGWWVGFALVAGLAMPLSARAQVKARLHGGIVQPIAKTSSYFKFGPSVGIDLSHSLADRVAAMVDVSWEYLNMTDVYATPTTNLWRYQLGLEGALVGQSDDGGFKVKALGEVGGTTVRSHEFWLASRRPYTYKGETINQTTMTATAGLRFGFRTPEGIGWWLTTKVNWLPVKDRNQDALEELSRNQLDPLGSALSLSVTLGVSLW